jgi:hypothetical protein
LVLNALTVCLAKYAMGVGAGAALSMGIVT